MNPAKDILPTIQYDGIAEFYGEDKDITAEAKRLQSAATELANPISIEAMQPLTCHARVLDVGAGADASLGINLINTYGCEYTAVDPNKDFIGILRENGISAFQGSAADLPVTPDSFTHVHARFVYGWFNEEQRKSALRESVRALEPGRSGQITIIDYDWSAVDGPEEYLRAIAVARLVLDKTPFNPDYGKEMHEDLKGLAGQGVFEGTSHYEIHDPKKIELHRALGEGGLAILEETADSLRENLRTLNDDESREAICAIDVAMSNLEQLDSGVVIRLPDIVVQKLSIIKEDRSLERASGSLSLVEKQVSKDDFMPASIPSVVVAKPGSFLDSRIRQIQATEYLDSGLIDRGAIDAYGMLHEDTYPNSLIERSACFAVLTQDASLAPIASVRIIAPDVNGTSKEQLQSLPTAQHLDLDLDNIIFPPGTQPHQVMEVSALVRNSQEVGNMRESLRAMVRATLGAAAGAKEAGYEVGIMTVRKNTFEVISKVLGEDNFKKIVEGSHPIGIKGTRDDIEYVSLYIDVQTFLGGVEAFASNASTSFSAEVGSILREYRSRPIAA